MLFLDYMSTGPGRLIRVAIGLVLMAAGAAAGGGWWALAAAGLLPLVTGVFGICPISPFLGRSWRGNVCRAESPISAPSASGDASAADASSAKPAERAGHRRSQGS